jgi:hypothetical protein
MGASDRRHVGLGHLSLDEVLGHLHLVDAPQQLQLCTVRVAMCHKAISSHACRVCGRACAVCFYLEELPDKGEDQVLLFVHEVLGTNVDDVAALQPNTAVSPQSLQQKL